MKSEIRHSYYSHTYTHTNIHIYISLPLKTTEKIRVTLSKGLKKIRPFETLQFHFALRLPLPVPYNEITTVQKSSLYLQVNAHNIVCMHVFKNEKKGF